MSRLSELLTPNLPANLAIPEPLERAWAWLESRGWEGDNGNGYFLTPYAGEAQLGAVFTSAASLIGWFEPGEDGADRLLPFVELDGAGSVGVLWLDDSGAVRVAALGSDGAVSLLAENAIDFLRLVAIGFCDIDQFIEGEPEDVESVEAHAEFRNWVETEFGVDVPAHWEFPDDDPFNSWVHRMKGVEYRTYA
ncbi:hypothetical protein BJ980_002246 [Nocardioides daedukensis]|uniref:SMI1/KNR4 family protein n=1 Tax=Nocardioides daedukensis TaxID=634462 RepID=A0A7Y9UP78_9ACTN|nr:hypothetical protein [Nocardioides daedukensis]NYG59323.1 hypothetical protein [Nocardioides daedukensis]